MITNNNHIFAEIFLSIAIILRKKFFFVLATTLSPPLSGRATEKRTYFCGFPNADTFLLSYYQRSCFYNWMWICILAGLQYRYQLFFLAYISDTIPISLSLSINTFFSISHPFSMSLYIYIYIYIFFLFLFPFLLSILNFLFPICFF